jgi:CRP-like cAMP-binding protein
MPLSTNSPNHFLLSLSDTDRNLIFPHLKRVTVPRETIIFKAEDKIEHVYFPHSGIISLIVGLSTGQFVEAGMLGRNGVIGAGAALDGQSALNTAIGQADGAGTMIEAGVLKRAAKESETLRVALVRQEHVLAAQTQQVAACNALHELEASEPLATAVPRFAEQRHLAADAGVPGPDVGRAAQQRHPCSPQTARGWFDQLSPWPHPGARC